jgi:hypothetical protein
MKKKVKAPVADIPVVEEAPPKQTDVFKVKVVQQAKNPQWVYCICNERDLGRIAAIIPRRLTNKLVGKYVLIEAISDANGTSYRYVEGQPH